MALDPPPRPVFPHDSGAPGGARAAAEPRRKFWGWGLQGEGPDARALAFAEASLSALFGSSGSRREPPRADAIALPPRRASAPAALAHLAADAPEERLLHSIGRSYRDIARAVAGTFPHPPDLVFYPESEADVVRLLDFASSADLAVIPFGGGTSVCGGVEPAHCEGFKGSVSLDLSKLTGVTEIDHESLAGHVLAGTLGPDLERALKPHELSLRHYPQSFEMSTVGGWIATRAGGHFATGPTHIDDLVESVRMVSPAGVFETRRLPGSGAGPDPNRLAIGSEGALGVITSAWLRLFQRPTHRSSATARFDQFSAGLLALRKIVQGGLMPTNARLLDGAEALMSGVGAGDSCLLLLAFESPLAEQQPFLELAIDVARQAGGVVDAAPKPRDSAAESYKAAFFRAPYLRDELILRGFFVETFETATVWSEVEALDERVRRAVAGLGLGTHVLARRITHAYRDGCAPYYTLVTRARAGSEDAMFWEVKHAITDAVIEAGGTSTHHHAVGRDVMPWYERERPEPFGRVLAAAKRELDPRGVMNPGVLVRARGA